jgi:hypothetical protein
MAKKLTTDYINTFLSTKGMKLLQDYVNSSVSVMLECSQGHQWKTRVANVLNRGDGCPHCSHHSSVTHWTIDSVNEQLKKRKIQMISDYHWKTTSKSIFTCEKNHIWETTLTSVLSGRGCKTCYGKTLPLTLSEIQNRYNKLGYTVTGEYVNYSSVLAFTCSNGHVWSATCRNTRCSACASYGFNLAKPAVGYILKFDTFIKYGISNSIQSRLYRHKMHNPPHKVVTVIEFENGEQAKAWENLIKKTMGGKFANKTQCPDGWTETLPLILLESVIEKFDDFLPRKF